MNPISLGIVSKENNAPGVDMLHEVTEAYQGAKIAFGTGHSVAPANEGNVRNPNSVYSKAHAAEVKQSGTNFYEKPDGKCREWYVNNINHNTYHP